VSDAHQHDVRTEKLDVEPRSLRRAGLWLVATIVGAMIVVLPLVSLLEDLAAGRETEPRPLAFEGERQAPAPRLQRFPTRDVEELRAQEAAILGDYAWVDEEQGVVRLPIERAMLLVVERGLPPPAPAPDPAAEPGGTP
jgi:hypothetical protein